MSKKAMKLSMLTVIIIDIYITSFFLAFYRVSVTTEIIENNLQRVGPLGISIVAPRGNQYFKQPLYYFYYPVHAFLQYKKWVYPIKSTDIFKDMENLNSE